jgi:hypothetical protein
MPVIVTPETFSLVGFDRDEIAAIAEDLLPKVGIDADADVHLEVNEGSPLGWAVVASLDPVTLNIESGALEDPKRPRQLSLPGAQNVIGRLLLEVSDRLDPAFGAPPLDEPLDPAAANAWETYSAGRLDQLGYRYFDQRQRRLYHFRNRHGFTDRADGVFERLWHADGLTFADLRALSDEALTAPVQR